MDERLGVIICAAGSSRRMGADKLFADISGVPALARAVAAFLALPFPVSMVIAAGEDNFGKIKALAAEFSGADIRVCPGGATRQESVRNALGLFGGGAPEYMAVHDGARPFVTAELIDRTLKGARVHGAAVPVLPVKETVHLRDGALLSPGPERSRLHAAQTPQIFRTELLRRAHENAVQNGISGTDDAGLVLTMGFPCAAIPGDEGNIKLTVPADLERARGGESEEKMRIGHGYDVHRLAPDRKLVLGGVEIPYHLGLLGHSDADVLAHAVTDALLGAAGLGDIGRHFPDSDGEYLGISSLLLLELAAKLVSDKGWAVVNIDATVICQSPKLAPHIEKIRGNIAAAAGTEPGAVNIKATTEEGLGFTGQGLGIAAHAVCLIKK